MNEVWVPQLGFRSADALRLRERAVARDDGRALAVLQLVSSAIGTEVTIEIKDDERQDACLKGAFDYRAIERMEVTLRDERGNAYPRSKTLLGSIGLGQHDFGFFHREVGFEPLASDVRRVELEIAGEFGRWTVPVEVAPIAETDAVPKRALDAAAERHGITVRLVGIALGADATLVQLEASGAPPVAAVRGIGAVMQRQHDDLLVIEDAHGRRYVEEMARETVARHERDGTRSLAKFPALPEDATELVLTVPAVIVEESDGTLEFTPPITEPRDLDFGPYPVVLASADIAHNLPAPPGQPAATGLRIAIGPRDLSSARRLVRPAAFAVDGVEKRCGWGFGWHPQAGYTNLTLDVGANDEAKVITLSRPIVRVSGPWTIAFTRPA